MSMDRASIRQRRQQFEAQFQALSQELSDVAALQSSNKTSVSNHAQVVWRMQYQVGILCAKYNEFRLAQKYFQQLLTSLSEETSDDLAELKANTLNWLAVMHFRVGSENEAMDRLLQATKCSQKETTNSINKFVTANYALFLYSKGNIVDAELAAQSVIKELEANPSEDSDNDRRARSTVSMLLSSISKTRGEFEQALTFAELAVSLADCVKDPHLISRAHNNLGIYYLEKREWQRAYCLFLSAYRATQQISDFKPQAIVKYHLGLVLSYLGQNWAGNVGSPDDKEDKCEERIPIQADSFADVETLEYDHIETKSTIETLGPKALFLESENLVRALPEQDHILHVLLQCCRGEEEYYGGDFHTAEAEFSIATKQLKELSGINRGQGQSLSTLFTDSLDLNPSFKFQVKANSEAENAKVQGRLLSYIGCTQLVEGKFALAEESHKQDLACALDREDLDAQHRALRNLAVVYSQTQRYAEAICLWREILELSVVLDSKEDRLIAYSGLGSTLCSFLTSETPTAIAAAEKNQTFGPLNPLQVLKKQRALALQMGDLHQQILAQQQIVRAYESHIIKASNESEDKKVLDCRLSECKAFVRLCEKSEDWHYRADAYRSLANALTSQICNLRARAKGKDESVQHAIDKLVQKRNSNCTRYQEAVVAYSSTESSASSDENEKESEDEIQATNFSHNQQIVRPSLSRLEILQRY
ncbi:putative tetratricopeptide-like helical domain superfamily [Plasmopara halstedii]